MRHHFKWTELRDEVTRMSVSKEQIESAIKEYIDPYLEKDLVSAGAI
jgi:hypothetical protein